MCKTIIPKINFSLLISFLKKVLFRLDMDGFFRFGQYIKIKVFSASINIVGDVTTTIIVATMIAFDIGSPLAGNNY